MLKPTLYILILLITAIVLSTRRLGLRNWQSWVVYALVGAAAGVGVL